MALWAQGREWLLTVRVAKRSACLERASPELGNQLLGHALVVESQLNRRLSCLVKMPCLWRMQFLLGRLIRIAASDFCDQEFALDWLSIIPIPWTGARSWIQPGSGDQRVMPRMAAEVLFPMCMCIHQGMIGIACGLVSTFSGGLICS
jgi:hypothetical protein